MYESLTNLEQAEELEFKHLHAKRGEEKENIR